MNYLQNLVDSVMKVGKMFSDFQNFVGKEDETYSIELHFGYLSIHLFNYDVES